MWQFFQIQDTMGFDEIVNCLLLFLNIPKKYGSSWMIKFAKYDERKSEDS